MRDLSKMELISINGGSEASMKNGEAWGRDFARALDNVLTIIGLKSLFR